jgi:hypothetical protein
VLPYGCARTVERYMYKVGEAGMPYNVMYREFSFQIACTWYLSDSVGIAEARAAQVRVMSKKGIRLAQTMQVGPHIPVGTMKKGRSWPNFWANLAPFSLWRAHLP